MFSSFRSSILLVCFIGLFVLTPASFGAWTDNPGGDETDETFVLGDALYPAKLEEITSNLTIDSTTAILDSGFSREAALFIGLYAPVRIISEKDFISGASGITLLIIPSGGLSSLKEPEKLGPALHKFVENGGSLFIFSQRKGKDYSILPVPEGEHLQGYGWIEDQSSIENSALLLQFNSIASGVSSARPHINIDGFFTAYPRGTKVIINKRMNGQPVFLNYKLGRGSVFASTLFTDWAFLHLRTTWDEISIFNGVLKTAGITVKLPVVKMPDQQKKVIFTPALLPSLGFSVQSDNEMYNLGEKATFTVKIWNNEDKRRTIKVYYDEKGQKVQINSHSTSQLTYTMPVFSTRRLWVYFYDENEIFLQTVKRGYIVVYPESAENKQ
ncbi:MAG: hypothetical protein HZA08_02685 [Nitrospirae bacterium]|nr:hypothetical protein [Nitrospirota bacterium]